jgi:hypothetical protein
LSAASGGEQAYIFVVANTAGGDIKLFGELRYAVFGDALWRCFFHERSIGAENRLAV